jgi:predicted metal-dependent hydrolase
VAREFEGLEVEVRVSQRARRARIVVAPGKPLQVVVPRRPRVDVDALLDGHRDWIARHVSRWEAAPRLGLDGSVWIEGAQVALPPRVADAAALERWYRREARRLLEPVLSREADRLGLGYASVSIRAQRTRWGSCSSRGALSFNWRLTMAPPHVLEYVAVHELCHLRESNHSKRFWSHLGSARPGWRADAGWLRVHGWELLAYRPESVFEASRSTTSPADSSRASR